MTKHCWYIIGAGAIGCLWAAYWRQAGADVVLITPQPRTGNTLQLTIADNTVELPVQCLSLDQLVNSGATIDRLLITTKAQDTAAAMQAIAANISAQAILICLQNGMAGMTLPTLFPRQTVLTAITSDGAYRSSAMSVIHAGFGTTWLGCSQANGSPSTDLTAILQELPTAYLDIRLCENIERRQWQKLAINSAINALTVIYDCKNGELLNKPEALTQIAQLCQEFDQVASAARIEHDKAGDLNLLVQQTLSNTAENFSSMYQDIQQKKGSEIDFINGAICQLGRQYHIATPHNQYLVDTIKALQTTNS